MSEFTSLGFTTSELRLINNWRIFFQVSTLAEHAIQKELTFNSATSGNQLDKTYTKGIDLRSNGLTKDFQVKEALVLGLNGFV
jgi:hypothetical protein